MRQSIRHPTAKTMDQKRFDGLVEDALEHLPEKFRQKLGNIAIIVEDLPPGEMETGGLLLGLFHGVPCTEKSTFWTSPPDRVYLYQKNIEAICRSDEEIRRQIRETLFHELGHYFGMTESELRDI